MRFHAERGQPSRKRKIESKNLNQAGGIGLYHFEADIPLTAAIAVTWRLMLEFIDGDLG